MNAQASWIIVLMIVNSTMIYLAYDGLRSWWRNEVKMVYAVATSTAALALSTFLFMMIKIIFIQ